MRLNKMEYFKAEIKTTKEQAQNILALMNEAEVEELVLEDIPLEAISDFVRGKRSNIWEIIINDNFKMEVVSNLKGARAMEEMVKEQGGKSFPLIPIPMLNISNFVKGKRPNIITLEMAHVDPGEELPGHV
jgi:hypothetical protein